MAKQIILYNLVKQVNEEAYKDYVAKEHGPLIESLPSVKKYELVRITGAATGKTPYKYVGILQIKDLDNFLKKDGQSQKMKDFLAKWQPMVTDVNVLFGDEIY